MSQRELHQERPLKRGFHVTKKMTSQSIWCLWSFHVYCHVDTETRKKSELFLLPRQGIFITEKLKKKKLPKQKTLLATPSLPWRVAVTGLHGPFLVAC